MKYLTKKLKLVADATLENQQEQIIRCYVFPFLFKTMFRASVKEAENAIQQIFADSKYLQKDLLFLIIDGLEGNYRYPEFIQSNLMDFVEVIQYTFYQPLECMDKVPHILMEKAENYSAEFLRKKLNALL